MKLLTANQADFGVLSTGELIAVALVLDPHGLLQFVWGRTLERIDRLGPLWLQATLRVQRQGW